MSLSSTLLLEIEPKVETGIASEITRSIGELVAWLKACNYAGYEPYDILNSPLLSGDWARRQPFATLFIQSAKRFGGLRLRHLLRVPPSRNPKALGLILSAYCDLAACGQSTTSEAQSMKRALQALRSPGESEFCWGYDWDYVSLRGTRLPAFSPNSIATYFCATALLDMAEQFHDVEAREMALSATHLLVTKLNRSVDTTTNLCLSYTPADRTVIYNSSALVGSLLARVAISKRDPEYLGVARRIMHYLADQQRADGAWTYGAGRAQGWIDSFHTGYNLGALLSYQNSTGDCSFEASLRRGYRYYVNTFFTADGAPKYFHNALYPIDVHCCSQAMLTFCDFAALDSDARERALRIASWTLDHMRNPNGTFCYQIHRFWTDRTPYIRWGQAWMLRALARVKRQYLS